MQMKRIRQGFSDYLVIEKTKENTYDEKIVCSNQIPALLPCELRNEDGREYFYYDLTGTHNLKEEIRKLNFTEFCMGLIQIMETLENYLLDLDHLLFSAEYLFIKEGKPWLCYSLERETNIKKQWIDFVEECVEIMSYSDKKEVATIYGFHAFLKEANPSLVQMKEYLQPEEIRVPEEVIKEEIEPWVEEMFQEPENEKKEIAWIVPAILFVPLLGVFSYTLVKIWMQGWLYANIRNAVILFFGLLVDVVCFLVARQEGKVEPKNRNSMNSKPKIEEENLTTILQEETQLLGVTSYPKLVHLGSIYPEIRIDTFPFVIGCKKDEVNFLLEQIGVSRRHAKIEQRDGGYILCDLHSTNGTYVNDEKIEMQGVKIKAEDVIRIGLEEFRFVI